MVSFYYCLILWFSRHEYYRCRVYRSQSKGHCSVTSPLINYKITRNPLDLIGNFVKRFLKIRARRHF